jgi:hypothetical protein
MSGGGFLYPIYQVTYSTTGQRMFSADGIFRSEQWQVRTVRGTNQEVLQPRRCDALDGLTSATGRVPRYVSVPALCDLEVID